MKIQFWQVADDNSATLIDEWLGATAVPGPQDVLTLDTGFYKIVSVHWANQLHVNVSVKPYSPSVVIQPEKQHDSTD